MNYYLTTFILFMLTIISHANVCGPVENQLIIDNLTSNKMDQFLTITPRFPSENPIPWDANIIRNSELKQAERITELEKDLYMSSSKKHSFIFSPLQAKAIMDAHKMEGELFNLNYSQIKMRVKHLRKHEIPDDVIRFAMNRGYLGILSSKKKEEILQLKLNRLVKYLERSPGERSKLDIDLLDDKTMNDIRSIILNAPKAEFDQVWKHITQSDLKFLTEGVVNGKYSIDAKVKERILALSKFALTDQFKSLWKNNGSAYEALLSRYEKFRGASHEGNQGGFIGGKDTSTLDRWEKELMQSGAGLIKHSRAFRDVSAFKRWLNPPWNEIEIILKLHNQARDQLEHIEEVTSTIRNYLDNANRFSLSKDDSVDLQKILIELKAIRDDVVADITKAYGGQDLFTGGFQATKDTNPYAIAKKIRDLNLLENVNQNYNADTYSIAAEKAIDDLRIVISRARKRSHLPALTEADHTRVGLKVDNERYNRRAHLARASEKNKYGEDTNVSLTYTYRWTEEIMHIETKKDKDGNISVTTRTEYVTRTSYRTVSPSYEDVIHNRLENYRSGSTVSAPDGGSGTITYEGENFQNILLASKKLAEQEGPFIKDVRTIFQNIQVRMKKHEEILANKNLGPDGEIAYQQLIENLDNDILTLKAQREKLIDYQNKGMKETSFIKENWNMDSIDSFKSRTEDLINSYLENEKLAKTYRQQVIDMEYELQITPNFPDYTIEKNKMQLNRMLNYASKAGIALTATSAGTFYFCKYMLENKQVSRYSTCVDIVDTLTSDP